jgi:hypothetical protein
VSTLENIDVVHDMILADRQIGLKHIAETLKISYEYVQNIVHVDIGKLRPARDWEILNFIKLTQHYKML